MPDTPALIAIPGLGHQDAAAIQSLLAAAGFFFHVNPGFAESPDLVLIRAEDLPAVKAFLRDYRIRSPRDASIPIPW